LLGYKVQSRLDVFLMFAHVFGMGSILRGGNAFSCFLDLFIYLIAIFEKQQKGWALRLS